MKCSCVSNFWSRISPALTQNFSADDWNVSFRTFCIGGFSNKWITVLVTGLKTDLINQSQPKTVESERLRLFTFFAYTRIKQGKGELWSSPVTTSRAFHLSSKDSSEPNLNTGPGLCQGFARCLSPGNHKMHHCWQPRSTGEKRPKAKVLGEMEHKTMTCSRPYHHSQSETPPRMEIRLLSASPHLHCL